jgi:hypothetical protein
MQIGEEFHVEAHDLLKPLVGRIVKINADGEVVTARVIRVTTLDGVLQPVELKVIPDNTKE